MLIRDLLQLAAFRLEKAGVEYSERDVELLLGHCLGKSRTELYLMSGEVISEKSESQFFKLLLQREQRIPLAYILGTQEFWSLDFIVSPAVLIPRPETELLLEKGIALWREHPDNRGKILDLCCGSGVIAVVLAKELGIPVLAVDISLDALRIARINAKHHGVSHLISFIQADLLSAFSPVPCFSFVFSNPPYVSREALEKGLQPEVSNCEPHLALDGGRKGLEIIKRMRDELSLRLFPGAQLLMEIGDEQGDDVCSLFTTRKNEKGLFSHLTVEKDYSGHDRIFHAQVEDEFHK
ncbi:MAG: peptide chain release factor N(5)-glutamine methyltransferase [Desulfocapsa sp.]|nr:peptide chain release factor N(5)-glutamine methyltransferase [Desulfocapsa sp.]